MQQKRNVRMAFFSQVRGCALQDARALLEQKGWSVRAAISA